MARAAKICSHPACSNLQPCPDHRRKAWATTSPRNQRRRSGWAQQRRAKRILEQNDTCHVCGQEGSDQVDHVDPHGPDDETNLKPIHSKPCHERKTQDEARRARCPTT